MQKSILVILVVQKKHLSYNSCAKKNILVIMIVLKKISYYGCAKNQSNSRYSYFGSFFNNLNTRRVGIHQKGNQKP